MILIFQILKMDPSQILFYIIIWNEEEIILIAPLNINKLLVKDKLF